MWKKYEVPIVVAFIITMALVLVFAIVEDEKLEKIQNRNNFCLELFQHANSTETLIFVQEICK